MSSALSSMVSNQIKSLANVTILEFLKEDKSENPYPLLEEKAKSHLANLLSS